MANRQFFPGQKIFAKVRGYPPWPAKVCGLVDETPVKQKYNVYFYGTRETAICKVEELYDYLEYRDKYGKGKPLKRKFFPEALKEIENELEPTKHKNSTVESSNTSNTSASVSTPVPDKDSDDEFNLVIDESPIQKSKGKIDNTKILKRKLSSGGMDVSEMSPLDLPTSRSGRKIKPKKFLDEPSEFNSSLPAKTNKTRNGRESNSIEEHGKIRKSVDQEVEILNGDKAELHWDNSQNVQELIDKCERSDLPKTIKKDFKKSLKKKADEVKSEKQSNDNSKILELLKIEVHLLDAEWRIKSSLSLSKANCEECLQAMDEILDLKLNAVMLKKHPEVVDTVKKLRKYVGNLQQWQLTPEQESAFIEKAEKIRIKADTMYNKFKSLFTIPNGKSFFEVYSSEVAKFQQKNCDLSVDEVYGLIKEPNK
ncbi:hypothetical protein PGB90_003214 [Kerria lacca]